MKQTSKTANKIILIGLLVLSLAFSLTGCNNSADPTDPAGGNSLDGTTWTNDSNS